MNALGPSLATYIRSSRSLKQLVTPVAHWYADLMGYRQMGLRYDDLRTCSFSESVCRLNGGQIEMEELPQVQRVSDPRNLQNISSQGHSTGFGTPDAA
jgi:ubiquinol-cytochrome c reductase subunit 7